MPITGLARVSWRLESQPLSAIPDSFVLIADALIDGYSDEPIAQPRIVVEAGRVVRIDSGSSGRIPAGLLYDYRGCCVVPGLVDSHVHLAMRPELTSEQIVEFIESASDEQLLETMRANAHAALASGVTTVRDCGSPRRTGVLVRDGADSRVLPRILVSGRPVTTEKGHCHWMGLVTRSSNDVAAAVRELDEEGVDFVKVMATGGMMTPTSDPYGAQFDPVVLSRLVAEAHARHKLVSAHVLSSAGVRAAFEAGVDTIEHYTTTTAAVQDHDPSLAPLLAAAGIVVGVTAHHSLRLMLAAGQAASIGHRLAAHRALREAGVTTVVHSDAGTSGTRFEAFCESVEIYRIGMMTSCPDAVRAATSRPARMLGLESEVGSITKGKCADLLVVDGRVGDDLTALSRVAAVFKGGRAIVHRT